MAMIARRFNPYPAYKDSGVEWLGKIPAHWEVRKWRYCCHVTEGQVTPDEDGLRDTILIAPNHIESSTGRILYTETAHEQGAISGKYRVKSGDIIYSKIRPALNKVCIATGEWLCSADMYPVAITEKTLGASFLLYLMLSDPFVRLMVDESMRVAMPKVNREKLAACPLLLPRTQEQSIIAAFLDRETARIDALVAKKERLIELLQEERTALITRAVTKGLDPNVPMKDSSVEWLREIPAHWEVAALKRRATRIQTGSTPPTGETHYYEDGVIPWYGPGSFTEDLPLQEPVKFVSESAVRDRVARLFAAQSAVIVTIGATIGKVAFMEHAGSCNQQITGVTFNVHQVSPRYGAYQLKRLEPVLRGIAPNTTLPIIDQEQVGYLPFAVPPLAEQRAIAAFLDRETTRIDALVAKIREAVDRLRELRTALISAAVTGKIDVREEAR